MLDVERVFTNRAAHVRGGTTSVAVRLPDEVVAFIDSHLDDEIANRSEFLQHWTQVGCRIMASPELDEAVSWALGQEPPDEPDEDEPAEEEEPSILDEPMEPLPDWKEFYSEVTISGQMLGDGPVQTHHYEPLQLTGDEKIEVLPEGAVVHLGADGSGEILVPASEVDAIHESQLEALRSRIR